MHLFRESEVASGFFLKKSLIAMAYKSLHLWVPVPEQRYNATIRAEILHMSSLLTMMTSVPKTSHMSYEIATPC